MQSYIFKFGFLILFLIVIFIIQLTYIKCRLWYFYK